MNTQEMKVDELSPYENNARRHTKEQIKQIVNSIEEFGFLNPILIDENNMILAGHGRYMAAQNLDLEKVPTIQIKNLTEAQKKAFVIADNKIATNSTWDESTLWKEIQALNEVGFDLNILAFAELELLPIIDENVVNDPLAEWEDMPEFIQDDLQPYRSIIIHFVEEKDVKDFFKLLDQPFSEKARYLWHPQLIREDNESKRYK